MRNYLLSIYLLLLPICFSYAAVPNALSAEHDGFIGAWSIDIEGGGVAWLNIHDDQGHLDAELMWIGGSVVPVSHIYSVDAEHLIVTRTEKVKKGMGSDGQERHHTITHTYKVNKSSSDTIEGEMIAPNRDGNGQITRSFTGKRTPALPARPNLSKVTYGPPIKLFNGQNLDGWKIINPKHLNGFKAVDGILVTDPVQPENGEHLHYGNLRTDREFEDFNLRLEVNIPLENNSGVYLRGLYEVQVYDSYQKPLDSHNMGALYSRITPSIAAEKPHDTWQTLDITLCDRHVTIILNGKKIIDNQAVHGPTGGALSSDVLAPGPIFLQGDHGNVMYRNIVLKEIVGKG